MGVSHAAAGIHTTWLRGVNGVSVAARLSAIEREEQVLHAARPFVRLPMRDQCSTLSRGNLLLLTLLTDVHSA